MRVLVTGAYGFIGAHIVAALVAGGHEVICAVREARVDSRFPSLVAIACDMNRDVRIEDWLARLDGIDAVINVAGILRENENASFINVHERSPMALFRACERRGIRRVIQISALGEPADGEFVASKHRCDDALQELSVEWLIMRPSLVYSAHGSYGGTSLLRAMSAWAFVLPLPGDGMQKVQPVAAEDIGAATVASFQHAGSAREVLELVGPEVMPLRDYLLLWRRWLGFSAPYLLHVPMAIVRLTAAFGERFGDGPIGQTMTRMLDRGNTGTNGAAERLQQVLGISPRSLSRALNEAPSHVQDRWHARLYFVLPLLRTSIGLLWMASGLVGWLTSPQRIADVTAGQALLAPGALTALARATGSMDLLLGVLCLFRYRPKLVLSGMLAMLLGYTLVIGTIWPAHWLDPFGGLLKNLPLLAILLLLLVTEDRR